VAQIQPRHFEELAKACRHPPDAVLALLREPCDQLPDVGLTVLKAVELKGMTRNVLQN